MRPSNFMMALLILSTTLISCCIEERAIADDVRTVVQNLVDEGYATSVVVGVLKNGRTEYYGYGAQNEGIADENMIFEIGSVTKIFTTLLLADMVGEGELTLEDPAGAFLPAGVPSRNGKDIALWHLATHTSGLPLMPDNFVPADWNNPYADYTAEKLYEFLSSYELTRDPGTKWEYSNLGAGLLGHILSLKSNMSYEELVKERICNELGLKDTTISLTQEQKERLAKGYVKGKETTWDFGVLEGCGALRSSARDLLIFLSAEMGLKKSRLYPAMELTQEPQFLVNLSSEKIHRIGLGWLIPQEKPDIRWHDGATGGYCSFVGFDRKNQRAAVVLASTNKASQLACSPYIDNIGLFILNPSFSLNSPPKPVGANPESYNEYAGEYEFENGVVIMVSREENKLFEEILEDREEIFPLGNDVFFFEFDEARIEFLRDDNGRVNGLVMYYHGIELHANRIT